MLIDRITHFLGKRREIINRLRILHIIDHFYPVLGYQETFLAKAHSRDDEVLTITSDRYVKALYIANKSLLKRIRSSEASHVVRYPPLNKPWLVGLERTVVNFKPDIIIVHGVVNINSIRIARLKSKLLNTNFIFDDHLTYNATRGSWTRMIYKVFKKIFTPMLLRAADLFVAAVSCETKRFMKEIYGIPANRS